MEGPLVADLLKFCLIGVLFFVGIGLAAALGMKAGGSRDDDDDVQDEESRMDGCPW